MPPRNRRWRFHGLKKPKIRQDWNKYNFYNLAHFRGPKFDNRTYFQQKWTAKATTRAYHGEQVNEKQWERMFSRTTPAIVPMNAKYLAENDGSEHAAGRGSGKDAPLWAPQAFPMRTPYMQMVYYPFERRLDTAIFRALFASSTRQARQHIVHGHVKVNGKKMIYPGYMLNAGDMFSVNPERVLKTTGRFANPLRRKRRGRDVYKSAGSTDATSHLETSPSSANFEESNIEEEDDSLTEEESAIPKSDAALASTKQVLLKLREHAGELLDDPPNGQRLSARQKQDLRAFKKALKQSLSRASHVSPSTLDDLEAEYQTLVSRIQEIGIDEIVTAGEDPTKHSDANLPPSSPPPPGSTGPKGSPNDVSPQKPPSDDPSQHWRPKDYMSAFAFIPRYLEVNHSICSAVYLRHPVCKPGFAEVPTPFSHEVGQLAFNWYLRRR